MNGCDATEMESHLQRLCGARLLDDSALIFARLHLANCYHYAIRRSFYYAIRISCRFLIVVIIVCGSA